MRKERNEEEWSLIHIKLTTRDKIKHLLIDNKDCKTADDLINKLIMTYKKNAKTKHI